MKVNVDVLVLNQVRSQPNSVAIINHEKVSENQYQTYIQAMMFPLQKFTIQMFRSTWCRIHIPKYFSPFNLMLIISLFFPVLLICLKRSKIRFINLTEYEISYFLSIFILSIDLRRTKNMNSRIIPCENGGRILICQIWIKNKSIFVQI